MKRPARSIAACHGVVLLEILVALSLIAGGGMLILGVMGDAYASQAQARRMEFAHDLARSKIAELDAGLISAMELESGTLKRVGSIDLAGDVGWTDVADEMWIIEVETIPSAYERLTEVVVRVYLEASDSDPQKLLASARQLVELREGPVEEYEEDPLLRGLTEGSGR